MNLTFFCCRRLFANKHLAIDAQLELLLTRRLFGFRLTESLRSYLWPDSLLQLLEFEQLLTQTQALFVFL
jgi:hypothetical protein